MELHVGRFGRPRLPGATLVVLCAYRGGRAAEPWPRWRPHGGLVRALAAALRLATLWPLRAHRAHHRDHFANPRPVSYQLDLARAALAAVEASGPVRLVVDAPLAGAVTAGPDGKPPEVVALRRTLPDLAGVDGVLLVYPDALGLGWGRLERRLLRAGPRAIAVVNGRRRLFPLDRRSRRALAWRRLLAAARPVEPVLAAVIVPAAALLAGLDRLRGRAADGVR